MSRATRWLLLIAMICTMLGQILIGFGHPASIVVACLSGALAVWLAVTLSPRNRRRSIR